MLSHTRHQLVPVTACRIFAHFLVSTYRRHLYHHSHLCHHCSSVLEYGTSSFVSLLNQAFLNLGNLNVLRVFLGPHWSSILCNVQFHQLTRFNSHFLLDEELIRFLTRHPAIEHLQLSDVSSQPVTQISDVYLPRLRHLVANSSWFGPLSRASQLRSGCYCSPPRDATDV